MAVLSEVECHSHVAISGHAGVIVSGFGIGSGEGVDHDHGGVFCLGEVPYAGVDTPLAAVAGREEGFRPEVGQKITGLLHGVGIIEELAPCVGQVNLCFQRGNGPPDQQAPHRGSGIPGK